MLKHVVIALALAVGLAGTVSAAGPQDSVFSQKYNRNGKPIAEKPSVLKDFIEFRTARGFPDIEFTDREGRPVRPSDWKGSLVLLDAWATWSEHSLREIPHIIRLQERWNKPGSRVKVVALSVDLKKKRVDKFIEKHHFEALDTYYDLKDQLSDKVPLDVLPAFFVLDANGHMVGFVRGFIDLSDPTVEPYIEKLAEKYAAPAAKTAK